MPIYPIAVNTFTLNSLSFHLVPLKLNTPIQVVNRLTGVLFCEGTVGEMKKTSGEISEDGTAARIIFI